MYAEMPPLRLFSACWMAAALLLVLLTSGVIVSGSIEGTARVVIDAYPNTAEVEQGTTLVLVCRVVGVPSTTVLSYQWTCPGGSCDAGAVDPEWAAKVQQGNILVVNVRNGNDAGNYTCTVVEEDSTTQQVGVDVFTLSVAIGLSFVNEDGGLGVFFPKNSFVTNSTLTKTTKSGRPDGGNDHIACYGGNPNAAQVTWHRGSGGPLSVCRDGFSRPAACKWCGNLCDGNGAVGLDPPQQGHTDIHLFTGDSYYVNQDLQCRVSVSGSQSAFIGVYLGDGGALQSPSPIAKGATLATTVSVSWSQVSGATGYYVSYQRQDLGAPPVVTPQYERIVGGASTSVTLRGLEPGTTYRIRVWSRNGMSVSSEVAEMDVTTVESAPTPPRMLTTAGNTTSSSVELNWLPPLHPNGAIRYEIEYEPAATPGDPVNAGNSSSPYFTLTLPNEFLSYTVRVVAVNSQGRANSSDLLCLGKNRERGPQPPTNVSVDTLGDESVVVSWDAQQSMQCDAVIGNYSVRYQRRNGSTAGYTNYTTVYTSENQNTLLELEPGTNYSVSVASIASNGEMSAYSDWVNFTTAMAVPSKAGSEDAVGPAIGVVTVVLLIVAAVTVVVIVLVLYRRRRPKRSYERGPSIPPLEPPTLSILKAQEHLSSSAESLLGEVDCATGLSTPALHKATTRDRFVPKPSLVAEPIPMSEFSDYVKQMHRKGKDSFVADFNSIPLSTHESIAVGERNALKNRYKNIFPYDASRVVLAVPDSEGNDYINASFVDGYRKDSYYIAAQAPKPQSLVDFWQMIWENRPPLVVMLTRTVEGNKRKSEDYYPEDVGCAVTFGPHEVKVLAKKEYVDYEVRTIQLTQDDSYSTHIFDHYLFTGWPDYGVPKYPTSLIHMLYHVREARVSDVPIVVHCSAGVGRTGTFIALDITLDQMNAEQTVDIKGTVKKMREKRMYMIQTAVQYMFVHTAVRELLLCGDTTLKSADLRGYISRMAHVDIMKRKSGFEDLFEILGDLTEERADAKRVMQHENKMRYPHKGPVSGKHLYVNSSHLESVVINASIVDGYHAPNAFIAAEAPLGSTLTEFWTMIQGRKAAAVVLLCPLIENNEESCHRFWPEGTATGDYGGHAITLNELQSEEWDTYHLTVQAPDSKVQPSEVTLFHYRQWPENGRPELISLLKLMFEIEKLKQNQESLHAPVVVACNDGLGRTGTFIAIWSLIEQMKAEGQIDVVGTMKSIRTQRPGAVPLLDQFRFCHEAIQGYLSSFEGYSNFDFD